mgnify:CR=1 FL=1
MKNTAGRNAANKHKEKYGTLCGLHKHSIDDGECLPMTLCSKTAKLTHEIQQQLHMNE